jgi:hypothetical protein
VNDQLIACNQAVNIHFNDLLACPQVQVINLVDAKTESVIEMLDDEEGLNLEKASSATAIEVLSYRFNFSEIRPELEAEELSALDTQVSPTQQVIASYLRAQSKAGATLLVDDDTYWAPSVNASAIVVIDHKNKRAILIMHGDADG